MMKAGVTGHRKLDIYNKEWITESITKLIYDASILHGYSCLALGADQLFVSSLLEKKIPYTAVIPCSEYLDTFETDTEKSQYGKLLEKAAGEIQLPFQNPTEDAFLKAGQRVVTESDIIIAVWDGKPAKGLGGTGDIVEFALNLSKPVFHIDVSNNAIRLL